MSTQQRTGGIGGTAEADGEETTESHHLLQQQQTTCVELTSDHNTPAAALIPHQPQPASTTALGFSMPAAPALSTALCAVAVAVLLVCVVVLLHMSASGAVHVASPSFLFTPFSSAPHACGAGCVMGAQASGESDRAVPEQVPEQFVWQYELCGRADSATEEEDMSRVDLNHFLLPHGRAAFPSFTVPMAAVMPTFHPELAKSNPKPTYVELYLLESFWLADSNEWKVAVNALYEGDSGTDGSGHYWHYKHKDVVHSVADKLVLTLTPHGEPQDESSAVNNSWSRYTRIPTPLQSRVNRVVAVNGLWWLIFPSPLPTLLPSSTSPPILLSLTHPSMQTSSTGCNDSNTASGWCRRSSFSPTSPLLRFSVCPRRYRPVEFSWCATNALHTDRVLPHLRSFISYHAYLGIHRFVVFDRGAHRSVLQPFIDAGLVDYRYWPWVNNRDFSSEPDNWSQMGLIALCTAMHQHTSSYWGLFDLDEWLHIARPDQQLPASDLDKARPVEEKFRDALQSPLSQRPPSSCLRFHPQLLAAEPDISVDVSAHSHHPHPLLHCESMLSWVFRALLPELEQSNADASARLQSAIVSAGAVAGLTPAITKHRDFLSGNRGRYGHMELVPVWVFNFDESQQQLEARKSGEAAAQAAFEQSKLHYLAQHNESSEVAGHYNGVFFTGSPERFTHRSTARHMNHKAFYRSSKPRDDTWIHPWSAAEDFVNPNVARFHHYRNIFADRNILDNDAAQRVSAPHSPADRCTADSIA